MWDTGRYEHQRPGTASQVAPTIRGNPVVPVTHAAIHRFEGEQVDSALQHIE